MHLQVTVIKIFKILQWEVTSVFENLVILKLLDALRLYLVDRYSVTLTEIPKQSMTTSPCFTP